MIILTALRQLAQNILEEVNINDNKRRVDKAMSVTSGQNWYVNLTSLAWNKLSSYVNATSTKACNVT